MKKRFFAAVAAILSATMLFGTAAFAAVSPTTALALVGEQNLAESAAALSGDGTEAVVGTVLISADYSNSTSGLTLVISTTNLEEGTITGQLLDQMNAILPAGYQVSEEDVFDVTLRDTSNGIYEGEGDPFSFTFGVGNEYDGMILTVYVWTEEGLIPFQGTVSKGKLTIDLVDITGLVRFYIAKPPVGSV